MRPFFYWVHKTLPLVYDDSLSYMELLSKVLWNLNKTTERTNEISEELAKLTEYVNNYFDTADFEAIIAEELDKMVEDGTLDHIVEEITRGSANVLNSDFTVTMPDVNEELDAFGSLVTMRAADIIALYDQIPELEKHTYGIDATGNPLVYYDYTAPLLRNISGLSGYIESNNGIPFLLLVSGIHGVEKGAVVAAYLTLKTWFADPEKFASVLNNVSMRIIPVAVPSAFNANTTRNSNGVNVNRNFPNGFTSGPDYGSLPLDQPESAFLAAMVDQLTATYKSGLFVVDAHQFTTSAGQHSVFWYNCSTDFSNYPEVRNGLFKTVGYLRQKVLEKIPELTPTEGETNFCRFIGIAYEPTFESYFTYAGACGFLCESPSEISGGSRYSRSSLWLAYTILANSVWCTLSNFFPSGRTKIVNLSQIGASESDTLLEVVQKMPPRCTLDYEVTDGTTLDASFPAVIGPVSVHIDSLSNQVRQITIRSSAPTGQVTMEFTNTVNGTLNQQTGEWSYLLGHKWIATTPFGVYQMYPQQMDFAMLKDRLEHTDMIATYVVASWTVDEEIVTPDFKPPYSGLLVAFSPVTVAGQFAHSWMVNIPDNCSKIAIAHFTPTTQVADITWREVALTAI